MRSKLWIETRVFLSFSIFIIIIVNIFSYLLYFFVSKNITDNINKNIVNEYQTIKTFIDLQKTNIFSLPKYEIEKINNLWFFLHIWNNDSEIKNNYKIWFNNTDNKEIVFRWDYKWYNIIIWKNIEDSNELKRNLIEIIFILNISLIISIFLFSYFLTKLSLTPLLNLTNFLNNYKLNNNSKIIKNNYWNTEIWKLTNSINKFIKENKNILDSQISFIQDVNHELKTPLMQIESNIELIEDKIDNERIKNKINSIKESSNNINEIVSNLWFIISWEKINKNKLKIDMYKYFLEKKIKYENILKEKNININIIKNSELIISNNEYYLDRLFWNIISNAIFYNKWNNDIQIILNNNTIAIIDKWIWINKEEIKKIFNRFYRNNDSWIYYKEWNWLWLVIVKKICDMFWWDINISSEIWKWSNFMIKLK